MGYWKCFLPALSLAGSPEIDGKYLQTRRRLHPFVPLFGCHRNEIGPIHALLFFNGFSRFALDLISHMNNDIMGAQILLPFCEKSVSTLEYLYPLFALSRHNGLAYSNLR